MNVKTGEMAFIIADPLCGNVDVGRIVDVVRRDADHSRYGPMWFCKPAGGPALAVRTPGWGPFPGAVLIPDAWLRPIRDSDGEDEMLRIAGLPKELERVS